MSYTRKRISGGLSTESATETIHEADGTLFRIKVLNTGASFGTRTEMDDVVTDDFFRRSKAGETINNPMLKVTEQGTGTVSCWGGDDIPGGWGTIVLQGQLGAVAFHDRGTVLPISVTLSDVDWEKRLIVAAINKSRSTITTLGENIIEAKKTAMTIVTLLPRLREIFLTQILPAARKAFKLYRRGIRNRSRYYRRATTFSEFLAGAWLEYRYGWMPIYLTVTSAVKTASAAYDGTPKGLRGVSSTEKLHGESCSIVGGFAGYFSVSATRKTTINGTYSAGVRFYVERHHGLTELASQLMLLNADGPSLFWETTKLSWLVDWLINVGAWLQAINTPCFIHIDGSWASRKYIAQTDYINLLAEMGFQHTSYRQKGSGGSYQWTSAVKERTVNPHNSLGTIPPIDLNFSSVSLNHVTDLIALLRQLIP